MKRPFLIWPVAGGNGSHFINHADGSKQKCDERGQVWRLRVYEVNPASGQVAGRG